jgi:hypothetical protein
MTWVLGCPVVAFEWGMWTGFKIIKIKIMNYTRKQPEKMHFKFFLHLEDWNKTIFI